MTPKGFALTLYSQHLYIEDLFEEKRLVTTTKIITVFTIFINP